MTTSQLMLGDLVMFEGETFKIDGISIGEAHFCGDEENIWCHEDNIEPIPLTAEILEKNGWTLLANFGGEAYWSDNGEFSLPYNKGQYRIIIHGIVVKITYLHELQHALRLCGLDYIADNFKI